MTNSPSLRLIRRRTHQTIGARSTGRRFRHGFRRKSNGLRSRKSVAVVLGRRRWRRGHETGQSTGSGPRRKEGKLRRWRRSRRQESSHRWRHCSRSWWRPGPWYVAGAVEGRRHVRNGQSCARCCGWRDRMRQERVGGTSYNRSAAGRRVRLRM